MRKRFWLPIILILSLGLLATGCGDPLNNKGGENGKQEEGQQQEEQLTPEQIEQQNTYLYNNVFARNVLNLYYLWTAEIQGKFETWDDTKEPIAQVKGARYKDDRWTALYDDVSVFNQTVTGSGKTYGFEFELWPYDDATACLVVDFTYADSPARALGLQRGDAIFKINGKTMDRDAKNRNSLSQEAINIINDFLSADKVEVTIHKGGGTNQIETKTLEAKDMYENPVNLAKVFDCSGKKVGYLHFTSFTEDACQDLIEVAKDFKAQGVTQMILDLRYNGGGYAFTEQVLASLLAPEADVLAGKVLSTEVYNEALTEAYKNKPEATSTCFTTEFTNSKKVSFSTKGANIGIDKLYAIIDSGTASASEAVLCALFPYLDIVLVGGQTHGKFCSGVLYEGQKFYDDYKDNLAAATVKNGKKYTKNWGLYVMIGRFADRDGKTLCMPDGLKPDIKATDNPLDGHQLGDPEESMLAVVLKECGYQAKAPTARRKASSLPQEGRLEGSEAFRRGFGTRLIELPR